MLWVSGKRTEQVRSDPSCLSSPVIEFGEQVRENWEHCPAASAAEGKMDFQNMHPSLGWYRSVDFPE
jgi:hypothetical protein